MARTLTTANASHCKTRMYSGLVLISICMMTCGCWVKRSDGPPEIRGHAMAYDPVQQQVMLFGGDDGNHFLADTWHWVVTADSSTWIEDSPTNHPSERFKPALACDSFRNRVVLFGGLAGADPSQRAPSFETWEWDGTNWIDVNPAAHPDPRFFHAMAYDSKRRKVVMFGGFNFNLSPRNQEDTWVWDGTVWEKKTPAHHPGRRLAHAMAYDANRERVVLFGGSEDLPDGTQRELNETWEWNGEDWQEVRDGKDPNDPPPRVKMAMAYDEKNKRVIMFSGLTTSSGVAYLQDTYSWDGTTWTRLKQPLFAKPPPDGRFDHAMAYDSKLKGMVMSGGVNGDPGVRHDTWTRGP